MGRRPSPSRVPRATSTVTSPPPAAATDLRPWPSGYTSPDDEIVANTADRPCRASVVQGVLATLVTIAIALILAVVLRLARRPGRARGVLLQLVGRRPDPDVDDLTLADRIRSELGPVLKELDLPHVHVMVTGHVAQLHGDVRWPRDAAAIERAVRRVSGVRDVQSHLHRGLLPSDTRPSRRQRGPSTPVRCEAAAGGGGVRPRPRRAGRGGVRSSHVGGFHRPTP